MTDTRVTTTTSTKPPPVKRTRTATGIIAGFSAFVILGTIAFFYIGHLIDEVKKTQDSNRQLVCAVTKTITANPIHRIPAFQTQEEFERQVAALNLIVGLSQGIDCQVVLGRIIGGLPPSEQKKLQPPEPPASKGGGSSSPPTGRQLPGGPRAPLRQAAASPSRDPDPEARRARKARRVHRERLGPCRRQRLPRHLTTAY